MKKKKKIKRNKKKYIIKSIIILIELAALAACYVALSDVAGTDQRFIRAANRGIYEGLSGGSKEADLREVNANVDLSFIDSEYDAVRSFKKQKFKNGKLGKIAHKYVNALSSCRNVRKANNPRTNYASFWDKFSEPYGRRLLALYKLNKGNYGLTVDQSEYKDEFGEVLLQGWAIKKAGEIRFERVKATPEETTDQTGQTDIYSQTDQTEMTEISAKIRNDSGYALKYMDVTVDLYDAEDNLIETVSAYEENIKKGKKFYLRFYESKENQAEKFVVTAVNCTKAD